MQTGIIEIKNEVAVVSHRVIAEHTEIQEKSVSRIIRNHKADFEEFGVVGFEIRAVSEEKLKMSQGGRPDKTYHLNEQQATLLMTYLSNTPKVVEFKKALVKAFYQLKAKNAINESQNAQSLWLISKALETMLTQQATILKMMEQNTSAMVKNEFVYIDRPSARLAHRRLSNEEKFIARVVKELESLEGLKQGELLERVGRYKNDKTALRWLHSYDGIYWRANVTSNTYSYSLIEEA